MTELEIINSIKSGDKVAYRKIIEKYQSTILGTIYNMVGFLPEAEDIAQEVFIRFYNNIKNFRGDSSLKTYLTKIAINLSLNELKRRNNRYFESLEDKDKMELQSDTSNLENFENRDLVHHALMSIDESYRTILNLRIIQDFSTKETADILQIPIGTVLSRLSRAQEKLKHELNKLTGDVYGKN